MSTSCLICLGSNYHREENFMLAHRQLDALFPDIHFAKVQETQPIGLQNPAVFFNQLGCFCTDMSMEKVIEVLKSIEREAGRKPEDKAIERVCLDIDLLTYGECVLKPEDLKRDYIVEGLSEFSKQSDKEK